VEALGPRLAAAAPETERLGRLSDESVALIRELRAYYDIDVYHDEVDRPERWPCSRKRNPCEHRSTATQVVG